VSIRGCSHQFFLAAAFVLGMIASGSTPAFAYEVEGPKTITLSQDDSVFLTIQNTLDANGPKELRFFHTDPDGSGGYFPMYCRGWNECQSFKEAYDSALADGSKLRLTFDSARVAQVEIVKPRGLSTYLADATDSVLRGLASVTNGTRTPAGARSAGLSYRAESGHGDSSGFEAGLTGTPNPPVLRAGAGH
jgi:hypothetical protein